MTTFQKVIIPLVILLTIGWFYWFQYRPSKIRQECSRERAKIANGVNDSAEKENVSLSREDNLYLIKRLDNRYSVCLHSKGL